MEKILKIMEAKYLRDYILWVRFSTGEEFELDLTPMLENDSTGIFEPLKNIEFFSQFRVDYTLYWGDNIDVAPEYIYFLAHKNDPEYQQLFIDWGYV